MLTLDNVAFDRGPRRILAGVGGELRAGRVTALVGPNGAGKSTLLRLLAGEYEPSAGVVAWAGKPLAQWAPRALAQRRAVLPQESHLAFSFPVREVVLMGRLPHLHGGETPRDLAIADAALARVEAAHLAGRQYTTLSGGEKQRVQLARVLAQIWEPPADGARCLLLDEPTANLDLAHQHGALQAAAEWARHGAIVLAVLHDLNLALAYADDAWVLDDGRLAAAGPAAEILQPPLIERVFRITAEIFTPPGAARAVLVTRPRAG